MRYGGRRKVFRIQAKTKKTMFAESSVIYRFSAEDGLRHQIPWKQTLARCPVEVETCEELGKEFSPPQDAV